MAKVVYNGSSDIRILAAKDLDGVEGFTKTSFPRHQSVEVNDNVAEVLVNDKDGLFDGEFSYPDDDELTEDDEPKDSKPKKVSNTKVTDAPAVTGTNGAST